MSRRHAIKTCDTQTALIQVLRLACLFLSQFMVTNYNYSQKSQVGLGTLLDAKFSTYSPPSYVLTENTAGVRNLVVKRSLPCDKAKISLWEQRNACLLPDDVRSFYASCDGFKLTWSYRVEGELYSGKKLCIQLTGWQFLPCWFELVGS